MKLTFLGTGDAAGVPLFGCSCAICLRAKSGRGRRRACSAAIAFGDSILLIDAGRSDLPELFERYGFERILLTHYHADHVLGLFRLRWGVSTDRIPVHGPVDPMGCADLLKHPGILDFSSCMQPFERLIIHDLSITPLPLKHSKPTLGYCFEYMGKRLVYLTDTLGLPAETEAFLLDCRPDVLVIDCCFSPGNENKRNHNDLDDALNIHRRISPRETWLTHISHGLDVYWLDRGLQLPKGVYVAGDSDEVIL